MVLEGTPGVCGASRNISAFSGVACLKRLLKKLISYSFLLFVRFAVLGLLAAFPAFFGFMPKISSFSGVRSLMLKK
jgi:hypothetical protein